MPGRPLPEPGEVVAVAVGLRVCWWDADYVVQRRAPDGSWYAVGLIARSAADTTRQRVRAALRAARDEVLAGRDLEDPREGRLIRWDGSRIVDRIARVG